MTTVTIRQRCSAPADVVWAVATDLANAPAAMTGITSTELLTDGPFGVGTRWRETRTMLGRQASETMTITAVEQGRCYTAEAESSGMRYVTTWHINAAGDGSEIVMTFGGKPTGALGKLLSSRVMRPALGRMTSSAEKAMRQDMADLAAYAETSA